MTNDNVNPQTSSDLDSKYRELSKIIEEGAKQALPGSVLLNTLFSKDGTVKHDALKEIFEKARQYSRINKDRIGLVEYVEFLRYRTEQLSKLHDDVVEIKWSGDTSRRKWTCWEPFTYLEVHPDGSAYTCCTAYVKHNHSIGNVYQVSSLDELWNSDNVKKLRYCVSNGDFEYCNSICKWLDERNFIDVPYGHPIVARETFPYSYNTWQDCRRETSPKAIGLSCDETCNLRCRSCRHLFRVMDRDQIQRMYEMYMNIIRPALTNCERLTALISGEFFSSPATQDFFKTLSKEEFPDLGISLITNGTLFSPQKWSEFSNLKGMVKNVYISVDAATKETYENLRLGGVWDTLSANLEFISSLKESEGVEQVSLNFVVQKDNFREMPAFIEMAKRLKCMAVEFQGLNNLGMYTSEEYSELNVLNPSSSCFKEARTILNDLVENEKDVAITGNAHAIANSF